MNVAEWKAWRAAGGHRITYVGLGGNGRAHGVLLSVAQSGLRVRFGGPGSHDERVHPADVRPGWL
ncbi:hypothetical protein SK224_00170 [Microbacterium sp. BG28]|uniref:hypothetical protein n=1 Tax=Microbacterium sp. BG28 TaxID=3097356 RepID=UPI002A5A0BDC|nr:hypothetical protein [Microbacterium sp. BG28]MDY0827534.1 hypothetical protein [Microbacterium sp. BG28]